MHTVHIISSGSCRLIDWRLFPSFYDSIVPSYVSDIPSHESTNVSEEPRVAKWGWGNKTSVFFPSASEEVARKVWQQSLERQQPPQTARDKRTIITLEQLHCAALFPLPSESSACNLLLHTIFTQRPLQDCSSGPTRWRGSTDLSPSPARRNARRLPAAVTF